MHDGQPAIRDAKGYSADNPVRIYADGASYAMAVCGAHMNPLAGIFDLFHFGHARALEQAKTLYVALL